MSTYASMTSASSSLPSASLLAWPPRSLPRSGHSSNSLDELRVPGLYALDVGSSTTPSRRSPFRDDVTPVKTSPKGKARALNPTTPEVRVTDSDRVHDSSNQDVSPLRRQFTPSKPLTPRQLGRIAQSFGIVIPALPMSPNLSPILPSGSPASASRSARDRNLMQPAIRPSPFLLVVVPPLCMLPSSSSGSAADAKDRQKRWKRGRLLPLQPTLGSMMLCIARDYGLPSTAGIGIYLVQRRSNSPGHTRQSSASSSASSFHETGPLISPHAWSTLFSTYSVQASIPSRSSTPSHTPLKGSGPLERDIAFPTSPLSLLAENRPETLHRMRSFPVQTQQSSSKSSSKLTRGHSSKLSSSSAASLNDLPPDPIVGTIEFEIDLDEATWFEEWRQSGGASRRKGSSTFEGPMKELRLVKKIKKDKPRFAEMDRNLSPTPRESAGSGDFAATMLRGESLSALSDESQRQATPDVTFTSTETDSLTGIFPSTDDLPALSLSHTNSRRPIVHIYEAGDAISASASMSFVYPDSEDVHDLLSANTDELLASPILLDVVDAERKRALKEALDKRGSALMMSEQLDDLEKIMRQLSPREIRLSSPKLMTPAMMTKLASLAKAADAPRISSGSQLKEPATRSFIPSQLARASTTATQPAKPINDRFSNSVDRPQLAKNETSPELGRPVWPAISHKASPESPSSSPSFQPPITKESPISAETLSRMNQTYNHSPPTPSLSIRLATISTDSASFASSRPPTDAFTHPLA